MKDYIGNETFMMTYGDGVADINIKGLTAFHKSHGKMVTVTTVHPSARFGEIEINHRHQVVSFKEKPQTGQGWINGGFFVVEPEFLDLIDNDLTILEKEPLEEAARRGELMAYQHKGFWHCMDTIRDRNNLEELWQSQKAPWKLW
jgi:glucose-1-phosphate cytidylyltransferase